MSFDLKLHQIYRGDWKRLQIDFDSRISFNILFSIAAVISDRSRGEIDIVTHNAGTPGRRKGPRTRRKPDAKWRGSMPASLIAAVISSRS